MFPLEYLHQHAQVAQTTSSSRRRYKVQTDVEQETNRGNESRKTGQQQGDVRVQDASAPSPVRQCPASLTKCTHTITHSHTHTQRRLQSEYETSGPSREARERRARKVWLHSLPHHTGRYICVLKPPPAKRITAWDAAERCVSASLCVCECPVRPEASAAFCRSTDSLRRSS